MSTGREYTCFVISKIFSCVCVLIFFYLKTSIIFPSRFKVPYFTFVFLVNRKICDGSLLDFSFTSIIKVNVMVFFLFYDSLCKLLPTLSERVTFGVKDFL